MAKAKNKTQPTRKSVNDFIARIDHPGRREDSEILLKLMSEVTGEKPVLWGTIVGFGDYHFKYESGREGDSMLTGFSPRKANLVVYIMLGFSEYGGHLKRLGKHKLGKSCLYLGRLSNVDLDVLRDLIKDSVEHMRRKYES